MFKNRLRERFSALTLGILLLGSLAAPAGVLAAEGSTCDQPAASPCGCCICLCQCGCKLANGSADCPDQTNETEDAADETENPTNETETDGDTDEVAEDETTTDPNAELRLNELLPNPVGADTEGEFIEIANFGSFTSSANGWLLRDEHERTFELPEVTVAPGEPLSFPYSQTRLTLVNSGGTLELVGPDGMVRDSVTYGKGDEGWSYAHDGAAWSWTDEPTPNRTNTISSGEDETADGTTDDTDDETSEESSAEETDDSVTDETGSEEPADETSDETTGEEEPATANVRLSELLPNPIGDDTSGEWIELHNPEGTEADLAGWTLDDAEGGSSPFALDGQTIPAGGYLTLGRPTTGLSLNNGGDTVRLFRPDSELSDSFEYADSEEGQSYAHDAEGWFATDSPTPGETNARPTPTEGEADEAGDATEEEIVVLSIEQVHDVADETRVRATGIVTVPFGVLGQTIFGLRDTDSDYGATVRVYASERPELQAGDLVTVDGTVRRRDSGELRLDTFGPQPITVVGNLDSVDAPAVLLNEIDGSAAGLTVTVDGNVTDSGEGWIMLTDDSAEHEIKIELPEGASADLTVGSRVSVRGIVRIQRSVIALAVLDAADLSAEEPTDETGTDGPIALGSEADGEGAGSYLPFAAVGALGAGGAAYRGLKNDRRKKKGKRV